MVSGGKGDLIKNSGPGLTVTWQAPTGGTAQASLYSKVYAAMDEYNQEHGTHKVTLGPADVRKLIEHAMASGWDVRDSKRVFKVAGPLDLKEYALP
jgi:hypothetical protein